MEAGAGLVVLLLFLTFYFLPFVIAMMRGRPNTGAIFVLNLLLGWTLVGWVVALVWAMSTNETAQVLKKAQALKAEENFHRRLERKCPHCAEAILVDAKICKHCRQPVTAAG